MTQTVLCEREFFESNISKTNHMVEIILYVATIVPISFIAFTFINIWYISYLYSIGLLTGSCIWGSVMHILNKYKISQKFAMFFGLTGCSLFIFAMGLNPVIQISLSFSFVPFISCLYFNLMLCNFFSVFNFLLTIASFAYRAFVTDYVKYHTLRFSVQIPAEWFISNIIGVSVEFIFVFIIANYLTRTGLNYFQNLISSKIDEKEKTLCLEAQNYEMLEFISTCIRSKNKITGTHVVHTQLYVELIANKLKEMGFYEKELTAKKINSYRTGAFLHDIGILGLPDSLLNSTKVFTEEEMNLMKTHTTEGKKQLQFLPAIENGMLNQILKDIVLYHHEKWNGSGYPKGLKGTAIPLSARIMAGADIIDALISDRTYRKAWSLDEAMDIIRQEKGTVLEPCIADAIIELRPEIQQINQTFLDAESIS